MITVEMELDNTFRGVKVGDEQAEAILINYSGSPATYKICSNIKKLLSQLDQAKAATKYGTGKVYVEYRLLRQIMNCMEVEDEADQRL